MMIFVFIQGFVGRNKLVNKYLQ